MFPLRGMPAWAQWIGEVLPRTWPIAAFIVVVGGIALARYRQTLD